MILRDIEEYVNVTFKEDSRDIVVEQIMKALKLEEEMEGAKVITADVVDSISENMATILQIAMQGEFEKKQGDVRMAAEEIAFLYKRLRRWATLIMEGRHHMDKINKRSL